MPGSSLAAGGVLFRLLALQLHRILQRLASLATAHSLLTYRQFPVPDMMGDVRRPTVPEQVRRFLESLSMQAQASDMRRVPGSKASSGDFWNIRDELFMVASGAVPAACWAEMQACPVFHMLDVTKLPGWGSMSPFRVSWSV